MMNTRSLAIFFCMLSFLASASFVYAVEGQFGAGESLVNPLGDCTDNCLMDFLKDVLDFVIEVGAVVVILMMVYVGFQFVTARGNATELESAKKSLLWTVIGALILLGAQAIATGIQNTVDAFSSI